MLRRALAVWAALPLVVLGASGLTLESPSPDALCPPLEETRRAVDARLGNVELDGTWRASYVLVHRTKGDFVTLSLFDPGGVLRLERELPAQGTSCKALPAVIAAVLERYFAPPDQGAPEPETPTPAAPVALAPPPTEPLRAEPAPVAVPPPAPARDAPPAPAPAVTHGTRLGAELWATNAWLAPGLRFRQRLGGAWFAGVRVGFDLTSHRATVPQDGAPDGSASLRRLPVSLLLTNDFARWPGLSLRAGAEVLGLAELAETDALEGRNGGGFRVVPGLGLRAGAHWLESRTFSPFLELTAAWLAGSAAPVFNAGEEVLAPPTWVLGGAFGIDAGFF
jgi:hypothetical protein